MQEFRDLPIPNIQYGVKHIYEDTATTFLEHAERVGLNAAKKCLDGTRTKILNEIVDWINNKDAATPRIFWLSGQAGKGKSAIAHTIALHAHNVGMLGSCFCFSRVRQHEDLHTKLFLTIAHDLAGRNLRVRLLLDEVMSKDSSSKRTNIVEDWQRLILEPLSRLEDSFTGNIVVVIDALDESGMERTRGAILDVLATHGAKLPANIRILLTSRPLLDIGEALNFNQHDILAKSLDDIDNESTFHDIYFYVSTRLRSLGGTFSYQDFQQLAAKSDGVFEWARLACDFISSRNGVMPKKAFDEIMSHTPGSGRILLDEMYTTFLKDLIRESEERREAFCSVMRQILWLKEPLPISALNSLRDEFSRSVDHYPVSFVLDHMASLLAGVTDESTPVRPLHASFYDFLLDKRRSREFFIEQCDVHRDLAVASLSVMQAGLRFNICELETSYICNSEVVGLEKKVEENILPHLLYSCRFWAAHLRDAYFDAELLQLVRRLVTGVQVLFWLEALGVSKFIGEAYWALISTERWLQVGLFLNNLDHHPNKKLVGKKGGGRCFNVCQGWDQVCGKLFWHHWQKHTTSVSVCIAFFTF